MRHIWEMPRDAAIEARRNSVLKGNSDGY